MNIKVNLLETASGKLIEGEISRMEASDYRLITKKVGFEFDWRKEADNEVYKLTLTSDETIVGLMSLENISVEKRVHVRLLEAKVENRGRHKKIDYIIGCLLAIACEKAILFEYEGFVSLVPKTRLIKHYETKYGFVQMGRQWAVWGKESKIIVKKYLYA